MVFSNALYEDRGEKHVRLVLGREAQATVANRRSMQEKQTMVGKLYLTPGYHSERRRFAKKAALFMILTALFLALASFAARLGLGLLSDLTSSYIATNVIEVVDVSNEGSIPTWFSSSVLLLCAILLAVIASAEKMAGGGYVTHWRALAVIFLLLSLDEVAQFHDKTGRLLMSEFSFGSVFHFAWVIPGSVFVLFVLLAYLKFLLALPVRTRWLFVVAGAMYVGGALGTEMIGGRHVELYGESTVWYLVLMTIEEFLEMAGAVAFFYALMVYEGSLRKKDTEAGLPDEQNHPEPSSYKPVRSATLPSPPGSARAPQSKHERRELR